VKRELNSTDVIDVPTVAFILRGVPALVGPDNDPEFFARVLGGWINAVGAKTADLAGGPWENGHCEMINARFRDKLLNSEIFDVKKEARFIIEGWRTCDNTKIPLSA
jgi:hypothetical protein